MSANYPLTPNVPGQSNYWLIDETNVRHMPAADGAPFREVQGELLRPYAFDVDAYGGPVMHGIDQYGNQQTLDRWDLPALRAHGAIAVDARRLAVVSFRYYKAVKDRLDTREPNERVVALVQPGFGALLPDHIGERSAFYMHGYLLGTCDMLERVDPERYNTPGPDALRNFSMPRMWLLGDLNNPQVRDYWGISELPQ